MANEVLTEVRGRVLLITLNRPEAMNAINSALGQGLVAAIKRLDEDDNLTAAVLTGAGRGFCAGMDLKAFLTEGPPKGFDEFIRSGARKPVIVAIEGFALAGGLEIALHCDFRTLARSVAKFTVASTPGSLFSCFSMRAAQAAQVMPSMGRSTA